MDTVRDSNLSAPIEVAAPSDLEREQLAAFRRAARMLLRDFRPHRELNIKYQMFAKEPTHSGFISRHEFRSLVLSLRLVYMPSEPAHVFKVLSIVRRVPEEWVGEFCEKFRAGWQDALRGRTTLSVDGKNYYGERILNVWLNAITFHQDPAKQADVKRLAQFEPTTSFALQSCVWGLCVWVYNLDRVVAYLLGEPNLPNLDDQDDEEVFYFGPQAI